jgi:uncharacterized glyoxalase superfamily protein PhnB
MSKNAAVIMLSATICDKGDATKKMQHRIPRPDLAPAGPARETNMKFASTRLIARDIKAMVAFYERVMGQTADWLAPQFAEIVTPAATLAIGSAETVAIFQPGSCEPAANRTAIIELMVDDVDALFDKLKDSVTIVHEPKLMPWGNRAAMIRDPEGTIVALFKPVSDAAIARFGNR